jgi:hypothetical protein
LKLCGPGFAAQGPVVYRPSQRRLGGTLNLHWSNALTQSLKIKPAL